MRCKSFLIASIVTATVWGGALYGADVAILDSSINTKAFFAAHYTDCLAPGYYLGADEYERYFMGWEYVLQHPMISSDTIDFDVIQDADVTAQTLSGYKLLILSNTVSLSDDQQRTIQQWVTRGGRLLATFGAGYKTTTADPAVLDNLKLAEGHTSGLHDLWQDPLSKVFGSNPINNGGGTDIQITQYIGPTAPLAGLLGANNVLLYGAESNILIQRPLNFAGALGFVILKGVTLPHPVPAILLQRHAQGVVVYFAFAPEYLVSKEYGLPESPSCNDHQSWGGRSTQGRILMEGTVRYLLAN